MENIKSKYFKQIDSIIKDLQKLLIKYKNRTLEINSIKYPNFILFTNISISDYKRYYYNKKSTPSSTPFNKKLILFEPITLLLPKSQNFMRRLIQIENKRNKLLFVNGKPFGRPILYFEPDNEINLNDFIKKTSKIPEVIYYLSDSYKKKVLPSHKLLDKVYLWTLKKNKLKFGANMKLKLNKEYAKIEYNTYKGKPLMNISSKNPSSLKKAAKLLIKYLYQ